MLKRVRDAVEKHRNVKVNTAFNGEFAANDKHAKSTQKTVRCTDLCERYEQRVIEPIDVT